MTFREVLKKRGVGVTTIGGLDYFGLSTGVYYIDNGFVGVASLVAMKKITIPETINEKIDLHNKLKNESWVAYMRLY